MRVLIVSQYFSPEITAAPIRLHPLAAGLARGGHDVEVVCGVPNHPHGSIHEGYRRRPIVRRRMDGFRATYVWEYATPSRKAPGRLASYASYAAMAIAAGSLLPRPDVVLASSPPLSVGAVGAALARRFRTPWVLDVRDLWPEAAVALGQLSSPTLLRSAERLESRLYASASAITTPTGPFARSIAAKSEGADKVVVLPNGTTQLWLDVGAMEVDRARLGLPEERFIWSYAGNLGLSQALDSVLDAAGLLGDGFSLLLIGHGPARERLLERANDLPAGAVRFEDVMPARECALRMRASDATLVPLADDPALAKSVPIKLYDCCAIARPVIVAAPGEARRLTEESAAALCVPPEDPHALAAAVRKLRNDPELGTRLSDSARAFAEAHLRERQVGRLEEILERVASTSSRA